jgi:hypothetical protein
VSTRQHQDGRADVRAFRANRAAQRDPVDPRQHHVEDYEVELALTKPPQGVAAVGGFLYLEAAQLEVPAQQLANGGLVLDEENRARCSHTIDESTDCDELTDGGG